MLLNGGTLGRRASCRARRSTTWCQTESAPGTRSLLGGTFTEWGYGLSVAVRTTPGIARHGIGRRILLASAFRHLLVG